MEWSLNCYWIDVMTLQCSVGFRFRQQQEEPAVIVFQAAWVLQLIPEGAVRRSFAGLYSSFLLTLSLRAYISQKFLQGLQGSYTWEPGLRSLCASSKECKHFKGENICVFLAVFLSRPQGLPVNHSSKVYYWCSGLCTLTAVPLVCSISTVFLSVTLQSLR